MHTINPWVTTLNTSGEEVLGVVRLHILSKTNCGSCNRFCFRWRLYQPLTICRFTIWKYSFIAVTTLITEKVYSLIYGPTLAVKKQKTNHRHNTCLSMYTLHLNNGYSENHQIIRASVRSTNLLVADFKYPGIFSSFLTWNT